MTKFNLMFYAAMLGRNTGMTASEFAAEIDEFLRGYGG